MAFLRKNKRTEIFVAVPELVGRIKVQGEKVELHSGEMKDAS